MYLVHCVKNVLIKNNHICFLFECGLVLRGIQCKEVCIETTSIMSGSE